jgi:hypothetical protein
MVRFIRSAVPVIGHHPDAIAFGKEITEYVRATYGVNTQLFVDSEGTLYWITDYKDYAAFGEVRNAITTDPGYWKIVNKAEGLLLDGTIADTVINSID